jgi:hypothetical protein
MLLCVKQMSSERVAASLSHWRTPRELYEWVRDRRLEAEAEKDTDGNDPAGPPPKGRKKVRGVELVFADTVQGEGRQKIGDQLSRDVSRILVGPVSTRMITDHDWVLSSYTKSLADESKDLYGRECARHIQKWHGS